MNKSAYIYGDGDIYRGELVREWNPALPELTICGLNPSTADAERDDQTIKKEIGFATRWGFGSIRKYNAYDYRATKPSAMWRAQRDGIDIIGSANAALLTAALLRVLTRGGTFMVAWGGNIDLERQRDLGRRIAASGVTPMCWGMNGDGTPTHPVMLPYATPATPWMVP